jgi:hypothetical protein
MVDCKWNDSNANAVRGATVSLGNKYALSSGLIEITYNTGAKVILKGPATYKVESTNGGHLSAGKLTGKVEVAKAKGFAVRTPTAIVTDLGTEFGVEVDQQGRTTSHVFRGSVSVQVLSADGNPENAGRVLHENESTSIAHGNRDIVVVRNVSPRGFAREIPKRTVKTLDLVDVVAGGDGFSSRRNAGIDPTSGRIVKAGPKEVLFVSDGRYHQVQGMPFVDGVFIPKRGAGPVQVNSAGHTFGDFIVGSDGTSLHVWAGGAIPSPTDLNYPLSIPTELDGTDYAAPGHGLLFLHANKGITFDLQAIRRANPDVTLARFCSAAGNVGTASVVGTAYADLWVFIDGQVRFRRREITRDSGAFSIAFEIKNEDRFLTLAATDGGNGIECDWILFGNPRLELLSTKTDFSQEPAEH